MDTPMEVARRTLGALYREEILPSEAETRLAELDADELAGLIVDAFERGWITLGNLGLNEDGESI